VQLEWVVYDLVYGMTSCGTNCFALHESGAGDMKHACACIAQRLPGFHGRVEEEHDFPSVPAAAATFGAAVVELSC
jgi:hypothetical protein